MRKSMDININFEGLSDRDIAERLFKRYGTKLFYYAMKSWNLSEDEVWEILYDTLYGFINSYSGYKFPSDKQIEALVWTIFKNKLRDKYRQKKKMEKHYQEMTCSEEILTNNIIGQADQDDYTWLGYSEKALLQEEEKNPMISKIEAILDNLKDWERQLVIGRANGIPYKQMEEIIGKKTDFLKVHYQRLKQRISKELKESIKRKEEDICPKIKGRE